MAYARGKYAKFISDRSGMEYPYTEMVKEWNGSRVHKSEFEPKHRKTILKDIHLMQSHYNFQDQLEQTAQLLHYFLVILLGLRPVAQQYQYLNLTMEDQVVIL